MCERKRKFYCEHYTSASCDASVIRESLENRSVGCGYSTPLTLDDPSERMDQIIDEQIMTMNEINKEAKIKENKELIKLKNRKMRFSKNS